MAAKPPPYIVRITQQTATHRPPPFARPVHGTAAYSTAPRRKKIVYVAFRPA